MRAQRAQLESALHHQAEQRRSAAGPSRSAGTSPVKAGMMGGVMGTPLGGGSFSKKSDDDVRVTPGGTVSGGRMVGRRVMWANTTSNQIWFQQLL